MFCVLPEHFWPAVRSGMSDAAGLSFKLDCTASERKLSVLCKNLNEIR
jgi:hypothetical protein